ncbi:Glutathione S-transferase [Nitrosomonas cryotolerans]|uniref:Glutathione S-transferase n=1 Tax=Nitrosomonas cryotolerans ATCC 49181 TaxID=1131553 RepID=A0A1N6J5S6_9PROT|nr:glutathione S-transferase [Nitrosomonas cryotolerans]SFP45950.1 Glutathione S-transferase [Nitrosomonas cryotolerans]SIO39519.1 Glutathione S-transferase [Nitrosomonas cryotolerans ATCC 49181]
MKPLLYTFRRCPYAIRARLAIKISGVEVDMQEVSLRNKPKALLDCSPKGTVPVLKLADGRIIEESLDIMQWALSIHDPESWMDKSGGLSAEAKSLIDQNDGSFKYFLDRYKYADRFPENSVSYYREQAERFLMALNTRLSQHCYLIGNHPTLPDMAIFPFVRQFAHVDHGWFYASNYNYLINWLDALLESTLFNTVMQK